MLPKRPAQQQQGGILQWSEERQIKSFGRRSKKECVPADEDMLRTDGMGREGAQKGRSP